MRTQIYASGCLMLAMMISASGCASFKKFNLKESLLGSNQSQEDWEAEVDSLDPLNRKASNRLLLSDLGPGQVSTTFKTRVLGKRDQAKAEANLNAGHELYRQAVAARSAGNADAKKLFEKAANKFRLAASHMPDSVIEKEALYYQGESYFFMDAYTQANRAYEWMLAKYAGNRLVDKVQARRFAIAQFWLQMANKQKTTLPNVKFGDPQRPAFGLVTQARRIFHRIRLDDPTGKLADDATLALANSYFRSKLFSDAADTYEDLRISYPGSTHQFHAHLFELKSRLASYQGKSYDGQPLEKADRLLKAIIRQFPDKVEEHREYLAKEGVAIRELMAERDWAMGQYYEKRGENRAAGIYYQRVADNFGDTQLAGKAQETIKKVAALPPVPKQKAKWLSDLFPDVNAVKPLVAAGDNESIFKGKIIR